MAILTAECKNAFVVDRAKVDDFNKLTRNKASDNQINKNTLSKISKSIIVEKK